MAFLQRRTETASPAFPLEDQDASMDNVDVVGTDNHSKKLIKDEEVNEYDDGTYLYRVGDTVYIESQRSDMPYFICTIREFRRSKVKGNITIDVTWFYRPCEIPQTVYQMLIQDRNLENGSCDHILEDPAVKSRELFISDAIDTYPASALRGLCFSAPFSEIKDCVREYIEREDHWFFILRYNPESRRMANAKGEIKIGVSHQAILPDYIPLEDRSNEDKEELDNYCIEELVWDPELGTESKVRFYLCAARSITSFNSFCEVDDGCVEKALNAFSEDQTTADAYDVLHNCNYDVNAALHRLVQDPPVKEEYKQPWIDEDRKKFMRGLRSYGKTFHKIRRELLPDKRTCDLVYYYYLWKKTAIAQNSRPHKRGRRSNVLARKTRASKPKTAAASEFLDLSSCSEHELENSDDSENDRDLRYLYACRHCYTTKSKNWHHAGKTRLLLCLDCRMYFKRYGCMKELRDDERRDPPPFIYKAAFENLDDERLSYTGRMRTRRSSTPIFNTNSSVRNRILLEISEGKHAEALLRKQVLCRELENTKNKESILEEGAETSAAQKDMSDTESCDIDEVNKSFRSIHDICEEDDAADVEDNDQHDDAVDADDEEENESELASPRMTAECSQPAAEKPLSPRLSSQSVAEQQESTINDQPSLAHVKEEVEDVVDEASAPPSTVVEDEAPSSPDVPNDPALDERIKSRFKHLATAEDNSCSRCERIFIIKKPKKKPVVDESRHHKETSRDHDRRRVITPPVSNSAASITSAYESMFRNFLQSVPYRSAEASVASPHGAFWPPGYPLPPELHAHRSTSPHSKSIEPSKYGHRRMFERHSDAYPTVSLSRASSVGPHPIHPFSPAHTLEASGRTDLRRPAGGHSHISSHLPAAMENLSRISSAGIDRITAERIPGMGSIDRIPPSERVAGPDHLSSVPPVQPHIHSHLHTHTHLHVHPDDARSYRSHIPQQESHHEHHTTHHNTCPVPAHSSHQSAAAAASYLDPIVRENLNLLSQVQHDPRIRESFLQTAAHARSHPSHHAAHSPHTPHTPHVASHTPHPSHPPHVAHARETTRSPPVRHESSPHNEAIAYRQWLLQQSAHGHGHSSSLHPPSHGSAPDLSPHGPHFQRSEQEKHLRELKLRAATAAANAANDPEKYLRSAAEHEKHYRHQMRDVEARMKGDAQQQSSHFSEHAHAYRPGALHSSYHSNIFMENMRRPTHDQASSDRISHERIMHHERTSYRDRVSHQERVVDRSHHDRPSIFGHRKPVTIDLSED